MFFHLQPHQNKRPKIERRGKRGTGRAAREFERRVRRKITFYTRFRVQTEHQF
jgi:hypothetical protein